MALVKYHYHHHAEVCGKCAQARDNMDVLSHMAGETNEIMELYNNSCKTGKDLLMAFWMGYNGDDEAWFRENA